MNEINRGSLFDIVDRIKQTRGFARPDNFTTVADGGSAQQPGCPVMYCVDFKARQVIYTVHDPDNIGVTLAEPFLFRRNCGTRGRFLRCPSSTSPVRSRPPGYGRHSSSAPAAPGPLSSPRCSRQSASRQRQNRIHSLRWPCWPRRRWRDHRISACRSWPPAWQTCLTISVPSRSSNSAANATRHRRGSLEALRMLGRSSFCATAGRGHCPDTERSVSRQGGSQQYSPKQ